MPQELSEVIARLIWGSTLLARPNLFPCERVRRGGSSIHDAYKSGVRFVASPKSVSVREGVPEELPEVIARLILGSTLWARPKFGEGAPHVCPGAMRPLTLMSA